MALFSLESFFVKVIPFSVPLMNLLTDSRKIKRSSKRLLLIVIITLFTTQLALLCFFSTDVSLTRFLFFLKFCSHRLWKPFCLKCSIQHKLNFKDSFLHWRIRGKVKTDGKRTFAIERDTYFRYWLQSLYCFCQTVTHLFLSLAHVLQPFSRFSYVFGSLLGLKYSIQHIHKPSRLTKRQLWHHVTWNITLAESVSSSQSRSLN